MFSSGIWLIVLQAAKKNEIKARLCDLANLCPWGFWQNNFKANTYFNALQREQQERECLKLLQLTLSNLLGGFEAEHLFFSPLTSQNQNIVWPYPNEEWAPKKLQKAIQESWAPRRHLTTRLLSPDFLHCFIFVSGYYIWFCSKSFQLQKEFSNKECFQGCRCFTHYIILSMANL